MQIEAAYDALFMSAMTRRMKGELEVSTSVRFADVQKVRKPAPAVSYSSLVARAQKALALDGQRLFGTNRQSRGSRRWCMGTAAACTGLRELEPANTLMRPLLASSQKAGFSGKNMKQQPAQVAGLSLTVPTDNKFIAQQVSVYTGLALWALLQVGCCTHGHRHAHRLCSASTHGVADTHWP